MHKITLLLFLLIGFYGEAQIVETMDIGTAVSCDDLYVDAEGIIYTGKGGLSNKIDLGRVTPEGNYSSVGQGMKGPISIVESPNGLLYVTNYDDNSIKTYDRVTDEVVTVATGLDGPAGIAIDSTGAIYASNWGGWPNYNGHQIHRLMPDGTFEVFKDSPLFSRLQGIALDDEGWLYTANTATGRIFKINTATAEMQTLVTMGVNIVNMEYWNGHLYGASIQENQIFKINLDGEWSVFAGTGASGGNDGPLDEATFNNPIGVGFSPTGDTMYISDTPGRIRRIVLNETTSNLIDEKYQNGKMEVYPVPSSGFVKVDILNLPLANCEVRVVDPLGKTILTKKINQNQTTIDLEGNEPGIYFLIYSDGNYSVSKKIIIR